MTLAKSKDENSAYHARKLWEIGVEQIMNGQVTLAMETLEESLRIQPSAEAHTYQGWARSFMGQYNEAILDCRKAIRIDPDFGNPYNDIGVYLMQLGRLDEAIHWLSLAKDASRYEPRHFPFLNLGHILVIQGRFAEALNEYVQALELDPQNKVALQAIADMDPLMLL